MEIIEKLIKLKKHLDEGVINDMEFQQLKAEILSERQLINEIQNVASILPKVEYQEDPHILAEWDGTETPYIFSPPSNIEKESIKPIPKEL